MTDKYYIDACIWRDFHENREDKFRPLGEWAFYLFRMIRETGSQVLYSELVQEELSIAYDAKTITKIFNIVEQEGLLLKVQIKKEQFQEAAKLKRERRLPFADVLHAIIARDNGAIMVTRDVHFEDFEDIVMVRKPEDLI